MKIAQFSIKVIEKARGLKKAMQAIVAYLDKCACDPNYPIIPSYTYQKENLDVLISMTEEKYHKQLPAIGVPMPLATSLWPETINDNEAAEFGRCLLQFETAPFLYALLTF